MKFEQLASGVPSAKAEHPFAALSEPARAAIRIDHALLAECEKRASSFAGHRCQSHEMREQLSIYRGAAWLWRAHHDPLWAEHFHAAETKLRALLALLRQSDHALERAAG